MAPVGWPLEVSWRLPRRKRATVGQATVRNREEATVDLGLTGKAALVTGASRGIGAAIAAGLAAEGCRVAVVARGDEELAGLADRLRAGGADVLPLVADLTEPPAAAQVVGAVEERFGRLDILVNNLGGGTAGDGDEAWLATLDVNLLQAVRCCRAAIPGMKERRSGVILIVASISGWMVGGGMPSYNVAKAAEIMFARTLGRDLAPFGIRANSISPGSIMFPGGGWARAAADDPTRIADFVARDMPRGRFGAPEEIADVAVFLCSDRAALITGADIHVDGCQLKPSVG
jgi:3-oxoacyl-[acyl-carrier protein] reductase